MFTDLPVMHTDLVVRRTVVSSGVMAIAAVALLVALGQPWAGLGAAIGVGAGLVNLRLFQVSAVRYTAQGKVDRRPFAGSVALRLGAITVVAFVAVYLVRPLGFGILGGLVLFQVTLMANALGELWALQRLALRGGLPEGKGSDMGTGPNHD